MANQHRERHKAQRTGAHAEHGESQAAQGIFIFGDLIHGGLQGLER